MENELSKKELDEIIEKVKIDPKELNNISDEIKIKYPQICLEAIKACHYKDFEEYETSVIDYGPSPLKYISEDVQMAHPEICKEAVSQLRIAKDIDTWTLESQRVTKDLAESGIDVADFEYLQYIYPNAIEYVSEKVLKKNPDILKSINSNQISEIEKVSKDILEENTKICQEIFKKHPYIKGNIKTIAIQNMDKNERWKIYENHTKPNPELLKYYKELKEIPNNFHEYAIALKLRENPTIATHFGDDLDNRSCIYILENWAKENGIIDEKDSLIVERIPAGKIMEGVVNIDTGGHKGSKFEDTIVIDGEPPHGPKSAIEELSKLLEIEVPEQILECADALPTKTSIFDTRSGMSLQKFTTIENVFKMAKNNLLTKQLTDEQLKEYNLMESHLAQQKIVDTGKEKVEQYTTILANGEKVVIAPEFIKAGSLIAYESGINYYASVDKHLDSDRNENGSTFAINAKPGTKLPDNIKEFGNSLVEKYKDETGSSGVFLHPNGSMLVAGGPKNPDFKIEMNQEEIMNNLNTLFNEYAKEDLEKQVNEKMDSINNQIDESIKNEDKLEKSKALAEEVKKEIDKKSKNK